MSLYDILSCTVPPCFYLHHLFLFLLFVLCLVLTVNRIDLGPVSHAYGMTDDEATLMYVSWGPTWVVRCTVDLIHIFWICPPGFHIGVICILYGHHMMWVSYEYHMVSYVYHMDITMHHMDIICLPHGYHYVPHGYHIHMVPYVTWSRGMSRMSAMLFLRYWQKQCSNSFVLYCF